jgi:hypothetical protein
MKELNWCLCNDPAEIIASLGRGAGNRELRLYACACCRLIWDLIPAPGARRAVEVSEQFADGAARASALRAGAIGARLERSSAQWLGKWAAAQAATNDAWEAATWTPVWAAEAASENAARIALASGEPVPRRSASCIWDVQRRQQCEILQDIFGNTLRPVRIMPYTLLWKNGRVVKTAATIYEQRRFDNMPELATVLEQAGCDDPIIMDHCRSHPHHVRGCWVLDAILGKRQRTDTSSPRWPSRLRRIG